MPSRLFVSAALLTSVLLWPAGVLAQNNAPPSDLKHVWLDIVPPRPCPGDSVSLSIRWCSERTRLLSAGHVQGEGIVIEIERFERDSTGECATDEYRLPLGRFLAGQHMISGKVVEHRTWEQDSVVTFWQRFFAVSANCDSGTSVPYLDRVSIRGPDAGIVCAENPIQVRLAGRLPSDCHSIRRVVLYQPLTYDIRPGPPIIRVLVDDGGCLGRPCLVGEFPWAREVTLPPLPYDGIPHTLQVEMYQASCTDTFPADPIGAGGFPFDVYDCDAGAECMLPQWAGPNNAECDAMVSVGRPAGLTFKIKSTTPLAGLQGKFIIPRMTTDMGPSRPPLRVTRIETIGAAQGMNLSWAPLPDGGASFVLFSENGSTIPASGGTYQDTLGEPVVRLTVAPTGNAIPPKTYIYPQELLGSDAEGNGVFGCRLPANVRMTFDATICAERPCDANSDGVSDVRDLVRMVHCLHDSACADTTGFDCDGDHDFALADVICCALRILRQHAPPDSGDAPGDVRVELGNPVHANGVVSLPVKVVRAGDLGALLLQMRYPSDRYALDGVDYPVRVARMALHSNEGDELALGLVQIPTEVVPAQVIPEVIEPDDANFVIRLRLRPGMEHGGELELVDGQFATPAGARIAVDLAREAMPIVPPAVATLSPARPNPFTRSTRFSVDLPRAARVEVTVHDLSGRRVAVLFQGELAAGRREFTWNGAGDRGGMAADGVYFLRLNADGQNVSRKVIVLRSP